MQVSSAWLHKNLWGSSKLYSSCHNQSLSLQLEVCLRRSLTHYSPSHYFHFSLVGIFSKWSDSKISHFTSNPARLSYLQTYLLHSRKSNVRWAKGHTTHSCENLSSQSQAKLVLFLLVWTAMVCLHLATFLFFTNCLQLPECQFTQGN